MNYILQHDFISKDELAKYTGYDCRYTTPSNLALVDWLTAINYCISKSKDEDLEPCYKIKGNPIYTNLYDLIPAEFYVEIDYSRNGWRLPTFEEARKFYANEEYFWNEDFLNEKYFNWLKKTNSNIYSKEIHEWCSDNGSVDGKLAMGVSSFSESDNFNERKISQDWYAPNQFFTFRIGRKQKYNDLWFSDIPRDLSIDVPILLGKDMGVFRLDNGDIVFIIRKLGVVKNFGKFLTPEMHYNLMGLGLLDITENPEIFDEYN